MMVNKSLGALSGSREPSPSSSTAGLGPSGFDPARIMREFYVSRYYEPKAERPADNVQAAIEFTLDRYVGGTRGADLALALDWALAVLGKYEPGDSRAVSDEFASAAAIACDLANDECRQILAAAIATEAQRAATGNTDAVEDEGAGPKDIAQEAAE
jgi:hypothetical protein